MRRRYSNNDWPEVERPSGTLNENEIEEMRRAYADGCEGDIIIGLRGEEPVITMLLPARIENEAMDLQLSRSKIKLREMGCNRYLLVRNRHP